MSPLAAPGGIARRAAIEVHDDVHAYAGVDAPSDRRLGSAGDVVQQREVLEVVRAGIDVVVVVGRDPVSAEIDRETLVRVDAIAADPVADRSWIDDDHSAAVVRDHVGVSRDRFADQIAGSAVDADAEPVVPERGGRVRRGADQVALNDIAGRIGRVAGVVAAAAEPRGAADRDAGEPGVARDHVALDDVVAGAAQVNAAGGIAQGAGARGVGADQIAEDGIGGRQRSGDADPFTAVAGDDVTRHGVHVADAVAG